MLTFKEFFRGSLKENTSKIQNTITEDTTEIKTNEWVWKLYESTVGKLSDWMMKWDVTVTQGKQITEDTQKTVEDGIKFVEKSAPIVKKKLEENITMLQTVDYKWKNEPIETVWGALWSWGFYVFLAWLFKWLRLRGRDSFGDKVRKNIFAQKTL